MRIVTRPDLDGVVCAVLLRDALKADIPVVWVEPSQIQKGQIALLPGDILANLPYDPRASLWFDHHFSNRIPGSFEGCFKIAPSAAGVIHEYYRGRFSRDWTELVAETDVIDSADLSPEQILYPELYPYVLVSMTLSREHHTSEEYWNRLVDLLLFKDLSHVMADTEVQRQSGSFIAKNEEYRGQLSRHTEIEGAASITDFRMLDTAPYGNRFLVFSLFPQTVVNLKISPAHLPDHISISVGQSIVNRRCNVNIGDMLSRFEGGGHAGAGGAVFHRDRAAEYLPKITGILSRNLMLP